MFAQALIQACHQTHSSGKGNQSRAGLSHSFSLFLLLLSLSLTTSLSLSFSLKPFLFQSFQQQEGIKRIIRRSSVHFSYRLAFLCFMYSSSGESSCVGPRSSLTENSFHWERWGGMQSILRFFPCLSTTGQTKIHQCHMAKYLGIATNTLKGSKIC